MKRISENQLKICLHISPDIWTRFVRYLYSRRWYYQHSNSNLLQGSNDFIQQQIFFTIHSQFRPILEYAMVTSFLFSNSSLSENTKLNLNPLTNIWIDTEVEKHDSCRQKSNRKNTLKPKFVRSSFSIRTMNNSNVASFNFSRKGNKKSIDWSLTRRQLKNACYYYNSWFLKAHRIMYLKKY